MTRTSTEFLCYFGPRGPSAEVVESSLGCGTNRNRLDDGEDALDNELSLP